MRRLFKTDTKPTNYNYLTGYIINSISSDTKIRFLKTLEKLLLKGLLRLPPIENKVSMESVSCLEGKNFSRILSVWLGRIHRKRKLAVMLYKINRFRQN